MRNFIKKYNRHIAAFFLVNFLIEVFTPGIAMALTSGPSQPEVQEFQAINVSDMVDPSSGDFSYNLPLLEVDGYPLNLSYRAGVNMDQEATCVGLGWNMNAGSISRNLRGIPDDFNGDEITKKFNMKENLSYGLTIGAGGEVFGIDAISANISYGISYNTYSGYDFVQKIGFSISLGDNVNVGLGIASSSDGLTLSPNLSLSAKSTSEDGEAISGSASLGTSYNSRSGIKELSLNASASSSMNNKTEKSTKPYGNKKMKDNKHSSSSNMGSVSGGSSIGFGSPTFIPQITMPMHTNGVVGSFKIGGTLFGVDLSADIMGNYSKQTLAKKKIVSPAYGYLNLQNGQNSDEALMDFNREKDGVFTEATTNLPIPNLTYDNFSVMGQGVGGSYRPYRSDIGYVYDPRASNTSDSYNIGVEVSIGNIVQGGLDFVNTTVDGTSGKWVDGNPLIQNIGFKGTGYLGYEPAYFKEQGEMNVDDDPMYTNLVEEQAVRFQMDNQSSTGLTNDLISENSVIFNLTGKHKRQKRIKRNQLFSYLSIAECQNYALQTSLFTQFAKYNGTDLVNGHHIGQITTTKTDGSRYVYGLPVYNNVQKEMTFNVTGNNYIQANNMITYSSGSDDTENNTKGVDNFFSSTETPPYTYAYMLTAVLSSDYVDKTGNGPTPDDLGTYTLFKYNRIQDYQWRTPHSNAGAGGVATLAEGLLSDNSDNKGSYVYGKKDLYYLTSVEGKNNIALLNYSGRADGKGVAGDAGGNGSSSQSKLDNIVLYSLADYNIKLVNPSHVPFVIKQANLKYNYSLCPGTYNSSSSGKLTLEEVYFSYGNSNKGKLSPYKFNYNLSSYRPYPTPGTVNITYNPLEVDRWGNFKPNDAGCPNSKYPYVEQNKGYEDQYIALWNLKSIQLPSGGLMEVNYESDDYAYIQNRRAGEMFKVAGFSSLSSSAITSASQITSLLFPTGAGVNTPTSQEYLYFKLKNNLPTTNFAGDYLDGITYMYFDFFTKVNCGINADVSALTFGNPGYEFVHGYAEIDKSAGSYGTVNLSGINYGVVKVMRVRQSKANSTKENPISKAAWQMARTQTPKQAYSCIPNMTDPAAGASGVEGVLKAMASASFIKNIIQTIKGYNGTLKTSNLGPFGRDFVPALSWVRLTNPDRKKLGGGHRVTSVKIRDQWDKMLTSNSGNPNINAINAAQGFAYGQQYDYTVIENGRTISSGVASYEPTFGADENCFRQPVFMEMHKEEVLLAPDNNMYVEEPMGESFFPSPNIIYSRVAVKNLVAGSGETVNEYFTAKDFPTYVHEFGLDPKRNKSNPIWSLFSFSTYDHFAGSQGYSIELNDMHGKPRAVHIYEEGLTDATSSTYYRYKQSGDKLVNVVPTVAKDGSIKDSRLGVEYDFYADFRENYTNTQIINVQGNLHFFLVGIFPALVGSILPSYHSEEIQMRTAVTNKVIYKYGIIDRVETYHNSNLSVTDNLLWDSETGQVLLTAVTTEFKDPLYSTSYPGHWAYEGLGGGYKDINIEIADASTIVNANGEITDPNYLKILYPGDEISIIDNVNGTTKKGYVDKIGNSYYFTESTTILGTLSSLPLNQLALTDWRVKVLRSGRHNLQDQKVGAVTTFINPLYNNPTSWPVLNQSYNITNATAIELGSTWQGYCGCDFVAGGVSASTAYPNQYMYGIKGNQRKIKDYTYLTLRKQTKQNGNSNIRIDGTLQNFTSFWTPNAGNDWVPNPNNWTWVSEATKYSSYGFDFENKDALERRSAAQYGFKQTLPVAVSSNSYYKYSANESFEYNDLKFCEDDHFGFNQHENKTYVVPAGALRVQKYSHTGKRSIVVPASGTVTVSKQINLCN